MTITEEAYELLSVGGHKSYGEVKDFNKMMLNHQADKKLVVKRLGGEESLQFEFPVCWWEKFAKNVNSLKLKGMFNYMDVKRMFVGTRSLTAVELKGIEVKGSSFGIYCILGALPRTVKYLL